MKFFIDGRFDVRPLAREDKPFIGIPYDTISYLKQVTIEHNAGDYATLTQADWGSGLDWITYAIIFEMRGAADFLDAATEAIRVKLHNAILTDLLLNIVYTQVEGNRPLTSAGNYLFIRTILISSGFFTSSAQTLYFSIDNFSGVTLTIDVYFVGLAVQL